MSYKNPISREDPNAIDKLYEKLAECERLQDTMKEVNSYYRKEGKVIGCPCLTEKQADALDESMRRRYPMHTQPYPPYALTNNNAEIRRLKKRIEELSIAKETDYVGWEFEGGEVVPNKENCRLQIFFDEKPDEEKRSALKMRGFHWSPTEGAWQRQLNSNAIYATDRLEFLKPLDGHRPSELQPKVNVRDKGGEAR